MSTPRRALLALLIVLLTAGAWFAPLDLPAKEKVDAGLKRALISYASARALHAVISLAQGTEASVQPFGVGLTVTPGRVLEPVHELVGQFSTLMLAASVVFGVQKALIAMGSYWPVSLALTLVALAWAAAHWRNRAPPPLLSAAFLALLMLRFAIPVVTLGTDVLWQKFLADDYSVSQQAVGGAPGLAEAANPAPGPASGEAEPGLLDKMKAWASQSADKFSFEALRQVVENATEHLIRLMVVFVLQTLVIPLLLAWILYALVRRALAWPGRPARAHRLIAWCRKPRPAPACGVSARPGAAGVWPWT